MIVGVTILLLGGAAYYFNRTGGADLLVQAVAQGDATGGVSATEVYSGTYTCTSESGCEKKLFLILNGDTTLEIQEQLSIDEGDGRKTIGTGSWGVGNGGAIIFLVDAITTDNKKGFSLIAKKVSSLKISAFSNPKNFYPGMKDPEFTRISE